MATRTTTDTTTTCVRHVAKPTGVARETGPHLGDLREFVAACKGLPDDLRVRTEKGYMGEDGRYDVTLQITYLHPAALPLAEVTA